MWMSRRSACLHILIGQADRWTIQGKQLSQPMEDLPTQSSPPNSDCRAPCASTVPQNDVRYEGSQVVIGSSKIWSHFESTTLDVIITLLRSYRSANRAKNTSISARSCWTYPIPS